MKKIIRLTESELVKLVKKVLVEQAEINPATNTGASLTNPEKQPTPASVPPKPIKKGTTFLVYQNPDKSGKSYRYRLTSNLVHVFRDMFEFEAEIVTDDPKLKAMGSVTKEIRCGDDKQQIITAKNAMYNKSFHDAFRNQFCIKNRNGIWVPKFDITKTGSQTSSDMA